MPAHSTDNRTFQRYAADFTVSIADRQAADTIIETAPVRDLSGGGLSFISQQADRYSIGQQLILHICLPNTNHKAAQMQGVATVVRIDEASTASGTTISLRLDEPLAFVPPSPDNNA